MLEIPEWVAARSIHQQQRRTFYLVKDNREFREEPAQVQGVRLRTTGRRARKFAKIPVESLLGSELQQQTR